MAKFTITLIMKGINDKKCTENKVNASNIAYNIGNSREARENLSLV